MRLYQKLVSERNRGLLAGTARRNWLDHGDEFDADYYHLAQAYRGRLVEDLFRIPQSGTDVLYFEPSERVMYDPRAAYVIFAMGAVDVAEGATVNSLWTKVEFHPLSTGGKVWEQFHDAVAQRLTMDYSMLKLIAGCELSRGAVGVAEKFKKVLAEHSKMPVDFEKELEETRGTAVQYLLAWLLLQKDLDHLREYVDGNFGSPLLQFLPSPVLEALVFMWDNSPEADMNLAYYGITDSMVRKFYAFKDAYMSGDRLALRPFKDTFWYYMLFTEI